jgi:hypothetical protein
LIISSIVGGLGNQMFQYAFAYSLSRESQCPLSLDLSAFCNPNYLNPEGYLLDKIFGIENKAISRTELMRRLGPAYLGVLAKYKIDLSVFFDDFLKERKVYRYDQNALNPRKKTTYVYGWWQCPRYFEKYSNEIKGLFKFCEKKIDTEARKLASSVSFENSVAVHIRLGDYVSNKSITDEYNVCNIQYYESAIAKIRECVKNPLFYIFSDEPDKVTSLKILKDATVISRGWGSWNDMYLMSSCKHNIIANSSFSWWGAYLNTNSEKIVVGPSIWLKSLPWTPDILCENWIEISI